MTNMGARDLALLMNKRCLIEENNFQNYYNDVLLPKMKSLAEQGCIEYRVMNDCVIDRDDFTVETALKCLEDYGFKTRPQHDGISISWNHHSQE